MKLVLKWREFKDHLKVFIKEADELLDIKKETGAKLDYGEVLLKADSWTQKCHVYLKQSFDDINNEYAQSFYSIKPYSSYLNKNKDAEIQGRGIFERLETKKKHLEYQMRILSVSDIIIEPNLVDVKLRAEYTNYEILDLILDKLYHLYDKFFYPIQAILRGNGIKFSNPDELNKLVKMLEKNSFINTVYSRSINAQLSLKGRKHVEEKRRFKLIDKLYFYNGQELLDAKISELGNNVNKTGLGKVLLMNELDDMKLLYNKLNKKNWTELLKGKLVDLETAKIISRDAMNKIYQSMTNEDVDFI